MSNKIAAPKDERSGAQQKKIQGIFLTKRTASGREANILVAEYQTKNLSLTARVTKLR